MRRISSRSKPDINEEFKAKRSSISVDDIGNVDGPVYVRNNTKPMLGNIMLTVYDNNTARTISIPRTRVPVPITRFAPAKAFANSSDFRSMVNKKILTILDTEEAKEELSIPKNKEYLERALASIEKTRIQSYGDNETLDETPSVKVRDVASGTNVHSAVVSVITQLQDGSINAADARYELDLVKDDMTKQSLEYVIANSKGSVSKWAQKLLDNEAYENDPEDDADYRYDNPEQVELTEDYYNQQDDAMQREAEEGDQVVQDIPQKKKHRSRR